MAHSSGKGGLVERSLSTLNQDHPVSKFGSPNKKDIRVTTSRPRSARQAAKEANVRLLTNITERLRHAKDKSHVSLEHSIAKSLPKKVNITDQGSLPRSESSPTSNKPTLSGNDPRRSSMHLGSSQQELSEKEKHALKLAELKAKVKLAKARLRIMEQKKARGIVVAATAVGRDTLGVVDSSVIKGEPSSTGPPPAASHRHATTPSLSPVPPFTSTTKSAPPKLPDITALQNIGSSLVMDYIGLTGPPHEIRYVDSLYVNVSDAEEDQAADGAAAPASDAAVTPTTKVKPQEATTSSIQLNVTLSSSDDSQQKKAAKAAASSSNKQQQLQVARLRLELKKKELEMKKRRLALKKKKAETESKMQHQAQLSVVDVNNVDSKQPLPTTELQQSSLVSRQVEESTRQVNENPTSERVDDEQMGVGPAQTKGRIAKVCEPPSQYTSTTKDRAMS